jgi:hypothetical protein
VRDGLRVVVIGAVLAGLRHHPQPLRRHSRAGAAVAGAAGVFSYVTSRPCSAAACMRWAATWKPHACQASTCRRSSCGSSASWA